MYVVLKMFLDDFSVQSSNGNLAGTTTAVVKTNNGEQFSRNTAIASRLDFYWAMS